ncbi:MAG: hypothetical protein PHY72_02960 [Candidatus Pacebacteria bacterium]|nr:hypothetical protein [Candidatus Paceibacterota bacterium]
MKTKAIVKKSNELFSFLSQKMFLAILGMVAFLLLSFYFYQIQKLINDSYLLSNVQKELLKTQSQNLAFSQQNIENSSLGTIEQEVLALNFVKNDSIKYIPLSNDYLVRAGR